MIIVEFSLMKVILLIKGNKEITQKNASLICYVVAKHCFPTCLFVGPVSEMQIPSNLSVTLNLCSLCNLGAPTQCSPILMKTYCAPNTVNLWHDSSIRANGATV